MAEPVGHGLGAPSGCFRLQGLPGSMVHGQEEHGRPGEARTLAEGCFPRKQLQALGGDQLAIWKAPSRCLLWGGHILKHFLSWEGGVMIGPPPPQPADEVC